MRSIHLYIIIAFLMLFSACENDLLKTTIQDGTAPVASTSASQVVLTKSDSANNALTITWSDPKYLDDTSNGNVVGKYVVEVDKSETFATAASVTLGNVFEQSYTVYKLNKLMLDLGCTPDVANDVFVRVKSIFFSEDTLISNVVKISVTPYTTVIPPAIAVPAELWISGDAIPAGWITPFPADQKFTQETATVFTLTIKLKGNSDYELITDGTGSNWTPCYRIDPALDPTTIVNGGTFVWDGNGSDYGWGSKKFKTPASDGTYKLTFNFQDATFTVVDVTGPPAIAVPSALYITGDATPAAWNAPADQQFTQVNSTTFTITIDLKGGGAYALITDPTGSNWTPCYRLNPAVTPAEVVWSGSFVWDGEGSDYAWGSKNLIAPPDDDTYKLTFDFQTATYTVLAQ